jgi:predicted acylesterase/phospholipase RssA/CRP-like cAMP-binding protein
MDRLLEELRAGFGDSHDVELVEDESEATALVRTLHAGDRGDDTHEVDVVVTVGAGGDSTSQLLRSHFPLARHLLISSDGGASGAAAAAGSGAAPRWVLPCEWRSADLVEAVSQATSSFRDVKRDTLANELKKISILADVPRDQIEWLVDRIDLRRYEAGQVVFEAGEPGDGAYIVRSGEVVVLSDPTHNEEGVVARLGRGEHFGEMALLTGATRSHSIVASLDSELIFINRDHCNQLLQANPSVTLRLSQILSNRLRRTQLRRRRAPRIIACHSLAGDEAGGWLVARGFAEAIAAETAKDVVIVDLNGGHPALEPRTLDRLLGELEATPAIRRENCARISDRVWCLAAPRAESLRTLLLPRHVGALFEMLTRGFDFVVVATSTRNVTSAVLARILHQCDRFLVDLGATATAARSLGKDLEQLSQASPSAQAKVALVGESSYDARPEWEEALAALGPRPRYRLHPGGRASGRFDDFRRPARQLVGIGIGVALGGGGGRAAAHIGVLDVLEREGVPVDYISGTSAGSVIAAAYASGMSVEKMIDLWERETVRSNPVKQYTISKTSLFSSRRLESMLQRSFCTARIEDLPMSFLAVAADLVSANAVAIETGTLWRAVRASSSVPGILPPVEAGDGYLVDGAVANNVPGDLLRVRGARLVIAVNVTPQTALELRPTVEPADLKRKGWSGSVRRFWKGPSALRIIMRSLDIQGLETIRTRAWAFDVHIHPPVDAFPTLEFGDFKEVIECGRQAAMDHIAEIKAKRLAILEEL